MEREERLKELKQEAKGKRGYWVSMPLAVFIEDELLSICHEITRMLDAKEMLNKVNSLC